MCSLENPMKLARLCCKTYAIFCAIISLWLWMIWVLEELYRELALTGEIEKVFQKSVFWSSLPSIILLVASYCFVVASRALLNKNRWAFLFVFAVSALAIVAEAFAWPRFIAIITQQIRFRRSPFQNEDIISIVGMHIPLSFLSGLTIYSLIKGSARQRIRTE